MNWLAIAKRDFRDARRSKVLTLAIGLFAVFVGLVVWTSSTSGPAPGEDALWNIHGITIWFLPIVVLIIGYLSIAGERETGRIKYLLGLPNTRRDVVFGKFLSRAGVSVLAVTISMVLGGLILLLRYPSFPATEFVAMTVFMSFFAIIYSGIAVGISAMVATRARAMGSVLAVYMIFTVAWIAPEVNPMDSLAYIVENLLGLSPKENLYEFVFLLSPSFAYSRLGNTMVFERSTDGAFMPAADAPFYLQGEFMAVILIGWTAGILSIGYLRFRSAELA